MQLKQLIKEKFIELNVYIPETTGNLTYSKIIWKVLTGAEPPVLNFMTTTNDETVAATNKNISMSTCHIHKWSNPGDAHASNLKI